MAIPTLPARLIVFYAKTEKASEGTRRHAWVQDGKGHRSLCGRVPPRPVREPYRFPQPDRAFCAYCRDLIEPEPLAGDAATWPPPAAAVAPTEPSGGQASGVTVNAVETADSA